MTTPWTSDERLWCLKYSYFEWRHFKDWLEKLDFVWGLNEEERKYLDEFDRISRAGGN